MNRRQVLMIASAFLTLAFASPAMALSNQPDAGVWQTNGPVHAITQVGNTIYLGGRFTFIRSALSGGTNIPVSNLAAVDATTGNAISAWRPDADDTVYSLAAGADGNVYAGGSFNAISENGVSSRPGIAKLNPVNGTPDGLFEGRTPTGGSVRAILTNGSGLYLGGFFSSVNGKVRSRLAKLSYAGVLDTVWDPVVDDGVRDMTFSPDGTSVYATGNFLNADGLPRNRSARFDTFSGTLDAWSPFVGAIYEDYGEGIRTEGDRVFIGVSGVHNRIEAYTASTGARLWRYWTSGDVKAITIWGNRLVLGGHFRFFTREGTTTKLSHDYIVSMTFDGLFFPDWNPYVHPEDVGLVKEEGFLAFHANGPQLYFGGAVRLVSGSNVSFSGRFTQ